MAKTEILAPVGNADMLYAGLAGGADSFYLAVDDFGARAYAKNFDIENVGFFIDLIHLFGKKVFVAMNILIKDEELEKAISYAQRLYKLGVDGLIIQDLGLFTLLKDKLRGMDLHASTQMAVRDYHGAKALMDLGFDRIVIARETPIEELRKIAKLDVEKEVFVHGSLCVSYSGECLMSSYFGARSANRGRCAGICRQKYELVSDGKVLSKDYFLNMKDLNVIDRLDELLELGIDCLKIEGRMKTSEYVFTSVKAYRDKIDKDSYDKNKLRDISNRGYTQGFIFHQNKAYINLEKDNKHRPVGKVCEENNKKYFINNSDLLLGDNLQVETIRGKKLPLTTTRSYKKNSKIYLDKYKDARVGSDILMLSSRSLEEKMKEALVSYKNLPIDIKFTGKIGKKPRIDLSYESWHISYELDEKIAKAKNISLSEDDIRQNLSKFGDEIYEPRKIEIEMDPQIFIRKKDINELRRQGINHLKEEILKTYHRADIKIDLKAFPKMKKKKREINIEVKGEVDPKRLRDFDNIYIEEYKKDYQGLSLYLNLNSHKDYDIDELIKNIKDKSIKGVIFNNYRDLAFIDKFRENGIAIRIGRYLNVFNRATFAFYNKFAEMISSSVEADFDSINSNGKYFPIEALAYGRIELMNMRHCPFSVLKSCSLKGCETCKFRDGEMVNENSTSLLVRRRNNLSVIYPKYASKVDVKKFDPEISLLLSVFSDRDLDSYYKNKSFDNINYDRGVI